MKRVLISRFAAFGDHIHASHLPRLLKTKAGFDFVAFEYNIKGEAIYRNNPYIDQHMMFNIQHPLVAGRTTHFMEQRNKILVEQGGYDLFIDLRNSIERGYIAMEDQADYYRDSEYRRNKFGKQNYYDQTVEFAGFPEWKGETGDIYFTHEEEDAVQMVYEAAYTGRFVVIANLSGTSKHKLFMNAELILKKFLERHKDAVVILTGDEDCRQHLAFEGERVVNRCGSFNQDGQYQGGDSYPFRQSMLMAKYADLVIGAESGLMVAANLFGAPTIQLMTAASIKNHGGDLPNDHSLQSPIQCSPCHKGPYDYLGCPTFEHLGIRYPKCVLFNTNTVLQRMEDVYRQRKHVSRPWQLQMAGL